MIRWIPALVGLTMLWGCASGGPDVSAGFELADGLTVGPGDAYEPPEVLHRELPEYPKELRAAGI